MRRYGLTAIAVLMLGAGVAEAATRTDGSTPAPATVAHEVTHVPGGTLDRVGKGGIPGPNTAKLSGPPLTLGGKPELLSFELAWCPHCSVNSWALAVALSRFGHLSGLRILDSGTYFCTKFHAMPCYPHTDGLSFFGAHYSSPYLSFVSVVLQDVNGRNLQQPTKAEGQVLNSIDSSGTIPAVDVGGLYGMLNAGYSPGVLAHKSWAQIAGSLAPANSKVGRSTDGLANLFSAAICKVTAGKPHGVCSAKGVLAASALLPS